MTLTEVERQAAWIERLEELYLEEIGRNYQLRRVNGLLEQQVATLNAIVAQQDKQLYPEP